MSKIQAFLIKMHQNRNLPQPASIVKSLPQNPSKSTNAVWKNNMVKCGTYISNKVSLFILLMGKVFNSGSVHLGLYSPLPHPV